MAEGTSAPSYRLSQGTQSRVARAGLGGDAREHLQKAAMADEVGKIATDVTDQIVEKQEDTAAREDAWDTGFDAMGDRGSWASGELFDQFQTMEAGYRDEYLEAVRKGDKKEQARMLKDQATRASGLKGWKETMETAKKINDGVGWSNTFKGDPESLHIMNALTTLDGKTAVTRFGENGEMVFDIKMPDGSTKSITRREADDMIAKGVKPVQQELEFMNGLLSYQEMGASGKPFDAKIVKRKNELNIKDEEISSLMREDFGGGGSFVDHIKSHDEFQKAFQQGGFLYENKQIKDPTPETPMTTEDIATFTDEDMNLIINEMEKNPTIAKGYIAGWKTLQEEDAWKKGRGDYDSVQGLKKLQALTEDQQKALTSQQIAKILGI